MGVMECSRNGCEEILCSSMFEGRYICHSCLKDLQKLRDSIPPNTTYGEIQKMLKEFWDSNKIPSEICEDPVAYIDNMIK